MKLKIDFHVHSSLSPDGIDSLDALVEAAKKAGLDGIALSDHDLLSRYTPGDIFILPACECSCAEGHIIALFISEPVGILKPQTGGLPHADVYKRQALLLRAQ